MLPIRPKGRLSHSHQVDGFLKVQQPDIAAMRQALDLLTRSQASKSASTSTVAAPSTDDKEMRLALEMSLSMPAEDGQAMQVTSATRPLWETGVQPSAKMHEDATSELNAAMPGRTQSVEFAEETGLPLNEARALIAEQRTAECMQPSSNLGQTDGEVNVRVRACVHTAQACAQACV